MESMSCQIYLPSCFAWFEFLKQLGLVSVYFVLVYDVCIATKYAYYVFMIVFVQVHFAYSGSSGSRELFEIFTKFQRILIPI